MAHPAPGLLAALPMYARYLASLPRFLRRPITLDDAARMIQRGMEQREENFLRLVERGIYGRSASPYLRLLRLARVELGDIQRLVKTRGITFTLRQLRDAGVYVSFEELKGRKPIVRHGDSFSVSTAEFNNPFLRKKYEGQSGGSTGTATRAPQDLDHLAIQAAQHMVLYDAHGVLDLPYGVWRGVLPDNSGLNHMLRGAHQGRLAARWFSPRNVGEAPPALRFQLGTYGTVLASRMLGRPIPWPEMVPIDQAIVVARWMYETKERFGGCLMGAPVSRALRIAIAAQEASLDLTGCYFQIAGEPPSPAKVAGILASGAKCFTTYGFAEAGRVGIGCVHPSTANDLHVLRDAFELIVSQRIVPGTDVTVDALCVTSLLLTTPLILLNAEMDDCGVVEDRRCGCPLERFGYHQHVRDIHSYHKLTGEGVSLVGSDMVAILERTLPAQFGGTALDYQLEEEEDEQGFTRLSLRVDPRIPLANEQDVIAALLRELEASSIMAGRAKAIWVQAQTFRVKREAPVWTGRGKLLTIVSRRKLDAQRSPSR